MLDGPTFPEDWPRRPIYELATWTNGLAFRDFQFSESGWPVIKIAELKEGVSGQTKFTRQTFDERYHVKNGDMLFSWSGNPETSLDVFWWRRGDGWLNQHIFKVEPTDVDSGFFYYLLRYLRPTFGEIAANKQTTGLGHVTAGDLKSLLVGVPPSRVQQNIAHVLGSLDDKIELNRRMNQTLEEICRALFKYWFVDFGPVRAKMEGRWKKGESLPGMPADMWDLWPSDFEESEIGEIPKGWKVSRLSETCSTQYGYTASATELPLGPHLLRVTDINKAPWIDWASVPYCAIPPEDFQRYALAEGDILVARMADPGKSAIVEGRIEAVFASYLVRLKVDSLARAYYIFYFLRSDSYLEYVAGARSGSVQANMNARVIVDVPCLSPSPEILGLFLAQVLPLRQRITIGLTENSTLAKTRNAALPKLLSGEIRVKVDT